MPTRITPKAGHTTPRVLPDQRTAVFPAFTIDGIVDDPKGVRITMDVEIDEWGTPRCAKLTIQPPDGQQVTWKTLRSIRVDRLLREAKARAASPWKSAGPGRFELASPQERATTYQDIIQPPRRSRRASPMTDEHLREVAEFYKDHLESGKPTLAICAKWHVTPPTASRWVARARERGMLGPAVKGRASA
jgi:hypothetical protein